MKKGFYTLDKFSPSRRHLAYKRYLDAEKEFAAKGYSELLTYNEFIDNAIENGWEYSLDGYWTEAAK